MMNSPSRDLKSISKSSKKIKKSNTSHTIEKEDDQNDKKYQTFKDDDKKNIVNDLWKGVILDLKLPVDSPLTQDLSEHINRLGLEKYNILLGKVLTRHVKGFKNECKVLTQWRKKVKSWITNMGKPETRGGLVVAVDSQERFRQSVIGILASIPCRCFPTLKKELLQVLKRFHEEQKTEKPFSEKTCSKHWWFNFMNKNPDIKEKWESIPLERTLNKGKKAKKSPTSSEICHSDRMMQEEEHDEQVGFTTCESSPMGNSSQETSPIRESDQTAVFSGSDDGMEEEKTHELPPISFSRFNSSIMNTDVDRFFDFNDFSSSLNKVSYDSYAPERDGGFLFNFPESS